MPTGKNWLNFIYINVAFIGFVFSLYYFTSIQDIKDNWVQYRCNPLYMPLSDNIEQDFTYCVQTMQTNYMGYLLQPLQYITSNLSSMGGKFTTSINDIRNIISNIRTFITSIIQSIFGIFLNLIIEFQKIIIGIKDMIAKLIGIMVTMLYILDGSIQTMGSAWNGPSGQMVRALGHCFHPETKIKLKNGETKNMKELKLGDILETGSRVDSLMQIDNRFYREKLYKIASDDDFIYVTGSHYVFCNNLQKFIQVKDYSLAVKQDFVKSNEFCCIITSDNKIKIGNHLFWDYEDWKITT